MTLWIILAALAFGLVSGLVAQSKRLSFSAHFVLGLFIGPVGLLIAICAAAPAQPQYFWDGWQWRMVQQGAAVTYAPLPPKIYQPWSVAEYQDRVDRHGVPVVRSAPRHE